MHCTPCTPYCYATDCYSVDIVAVQACRYLELAPKNPDGLLIFGLSHLIVRTAMSSVHPLSDRHVLWFYLKCYSYLDPYQPTDVQTQCTLSFNVSSSLLVHPPTE